MPLGDSAVLHVPALFLCPRNVFSAFPLPSYEWPPITLNLQSLKQTDLACFNFNILVQNDCFPLQFVSDLSFKN